MPRTSGCRRLPAQLLLAIVVALGAAVGLASPALAVSPITVDFPSDNTYSSGAEVTVSGYNSSSDYETISVECKNSSRSPMDNVPPGSFSVSMGSFKGPDTCHVLDYYTDDQLATFFVAAPKIRVSDAAVSDSEFYPTVRDGYRDTVKFTWRQERQARATITVVNADGRAVRTAKPNASGGRNAWIWNGRKDNGDVAAKGRYRIDVSVNANADVARVKVATGVITKTFRKRLEGNQGVSFATRGDCYASRDSYYQIAKLDCWGGTFARASYRIRIPADAFDVRGTIDLNPSGADICCRGRITRGWSQPSARTVAFWAQVTGWRATEVNYVRVSYQAKVRI